jgi:hypothetical protein
MTKVTLAALGDVKIIEVCKNQVTAFTTLVSKTGKKSTLVKPISSIILQAEDAT